MESWPIDILPNPTVDFEGDLQTSVVSTKMDSGRVRRRRRFSAEYRTYNVSWQLDDFQFGMFQSWFLHKLNAGADDFLIDLPTGGESLKTVTAAFVDGKYSHRYEGVLRYRVTAQLEVNDALVWDEDTYDTLYPVGSIVALEAAVTHLETFVNN